jgi:radical SAM superfamily enzyme YgiQ (UPF0313 family)
MLLPPQELLALGGIIKEFEGVHTTLIDCIAEKLTRTQLAVRLKAIEPHVIVAIQGFECFEEDINELNALKEHLPAVKLVLFGHYTTVFPHQILQKTDIDITIIGEPDLIFRDLIYALLNQIDIQTVAGIAFKSSEGIIQTEGEIRIREPEKLPMPAYELLQPDKYYEPFMKAPFGLIQTARGCPYSCNYCVRSFGKKLTYRTPEQIIEEILYLKKTFGIRSLRFIDDTFTVHTSRVIEICKRMIELQLDIEWTCLSRLDTLREEMLPWMKKAGCKRIYFGVESGSPKVLKFLNKELDLDEALKTIHLCRQHGIETHGWFIVGAPVETEDDFEASVNFALNANFDYVAVSELIVYPGTPLYEQVQNDVQFSLLPYKNQWKNNTLKLVSLQREKEFYRRFYFRRKYVARRVIHALQHPAEYLSNTVKLAGYVMTPRDTKRADYF